MRIIFCGGGTAGHITPAIAIAQSLKDRISDTEILFIGREGGGENRTVEKSNLPIKTLKINGFERRLTIKNIKNLFTAAKALKEAKTIIKDFRPNVVVGTGGYVTWPIIRAAQKLKIPTAIHESNAVPGLVTRLLAGKCNRVFINFADTAKELKRCDNIKVVGNPVRKEFVALTRCDARKKLGIKENEILISSFGGSGGSKMINNTVMPIMEKHSSKKKNIRHIHCCGNKYYSEYKRRYPQFEKNHNGCIMMAYIDDMPTVIKASDIVITRCGAMTLAEISASAVAAILIPSPNVTGDHQYKNANLIYKLGAGMLLEEKNLCEESLISVLEQLENDLHLRKSIAQKINGLYVHNSNKIIAEEIIRLTK